MMYGKALSPDIQMQIIVYPRIHVGLISMHRSSPRKNGGLGFGLSGPGSTLTFSASDKFDVMDLRNRPLASGEIMRLSSTLEKAKASLNFELAIRVRIDGPLATHVGMGSGTAIRLACVEALAALNRTQLTRDSLVQLSGRGGTSGTGINTYFEGGMILDLGVRQDGDTSLPSAFADPTSLPLSLPRVTLPDWEVCLCIPRSVRTKSQDEEAEFFRRTLPLSPEASYRACYEAIFGVYAAILDRDAIAFGFAIERMQLTDWKAKEWDEYGNDLKAIRDRLRGLGADYVGMSSLGPMLFAGGPADFVSMAVESEGSLDCDIFLTRMSNTGRTIRASMPCDN